MSACRALLLAVTMVALAAAPSVADMTIKLRDGRVVTVPGINPGDVDSMSFSPNGAAPAASPLAAGTAAPVALPPPGPADTALGGASPSAGVVLPPQSLLPPPKGPEHPSGRTLHVGPNRDIKVPSEAAKQAKDGDIVEIDAGNYRGDVAVWTASDILIRGVGGRPHLDADGSAAQGKAIWVTHGDKIRIENIEFSGCHVPDGNGAAIRAEGAGLTLVNVFIHDNEDGLLSAPNPNSDIVIEDSEFAHNGTSSGATHGIYIGDVRNFVLRGSYFHDTVTGHHVKTRAQTSYILYNRILDYSNGNASYSIDFSNGGRAYVIGNIIEKGPRAENYASIAFAMEGPTQKLQELYVVGNTMLMDRSSGIFIRSRGPNVAFVADNIFAGPGIVITGDGKLVNNVIANGAHADDPNAGGGSGNKIGGDAKFVDAAHYDYHLLPGSPAIGAGIDPGMGGGYKLLPNYQPLAPLGFIARPASTPLDDGALSSH